MQTIWKQFYPFYHNVFNDIVDDYLGEEDFFVSSNMGDKNEGLHKNGKLIVKSLLYTGMMFSNVIGLKY